MLILVVGGAASGKSELAEKIILQSACIPRVYIATMRVWDNESRCRVQKHRSMRAQKAFETWETPVQLRTAAEKLPPGSAVLLEDMTNLCANELFDPEGIGLAAGTDNPAEKACAAILEGVRVLEQKSGLAVVVSGDLTGGGLLYQGETREYLRLLAQLNNRLAAMADIVYEAVCGQAICRKPAGYKQAVSAEGRKE